MSQNRTIGTGWILSINNSGNNSSPTFQPLGVGYQKTGDIDMTNKEVEVTGKADNGWKSGIPGINNMSFDCDFSLILTDPAYIQLKTSWIARTQAYCQMLRPDGSRYVANVNITTLKEATPVDKEVTVKCTLSVDGAPVVIQ